MSDGTPLVSIVIAAYGMPDYLNQAVRSVCGQTFCDYEIVVVDDASGEAVTSKYELPECARLICHEKRFGAAAATRNTGIKAARGKYIAFLDQDDIWLPEKLAVQVQALEDNPKAGLTFCHCVAVDDSLKPLPKQRKLRKSVRDPLRKLIRGCFISTPSAVMVRKEVLEECGMLNESVIGASDWDLYLRIARNYTFIAIPLPLVFYRIHSSQLSKRKIMMRNATLLILDKTLEWAKTERPSVVNAIRRSYCRVLRKVARSQMLDEGDVHGALRSLRQARSLWPWSFRIYGLMIRALIRSRRMSFQSEESNTE